MPIHECTEDGKPGFQWGGSGACYTYSPGDHASRVHAQQQAAAQGYAVGDHGAYDTLDAPEPERKHAGIEVCSDGGRPGYRYGNSACYTYDGDNDGVGRARARRHAQRLMEADMGHQEPDADDAGGPSDHDADDKMDGEEGGSALNRRGGLGVRRKAFDDQQMTAGTATPADMEAIKLYALAPGDPNDIFTGHMKLANDRYDRQHERFTKDYLERFAQTLPGKSVMTGHDYSNAPVGRFYNASVEPDAEGYHLKASYFMRANHPLAQDVRLGVLKDVSIGFQPDKRFCDLCGKDYDGWQHWSMPTNTKDDGSEPDMEEPCTHVAGQQYDGGRCTLTYGGDLTKVEAHEGSFVWLGCQYGAQTTARSADAGKRAFVAKHYNERLYHSLIEATKEMAMDPKEAAALTAELQKLKAENERLKALAADGEAWKEWLAKDYLNKCDSLAGKESAEARAILRVMDKASARDFFPLWQEKDEQHAVAFAANGAHLDQPDRTKDAPQGISREEYLFGVRRAN